MTSWSARARALLVLLMLSVVSVPTVAAAAAATPPEGRGSYVVALMGDSPIAGRSWIRLAEYSFRADGTARMDYWSWNQTVLYDKTRTGFRTNGCAYDCGVWTSEGFEGAPKQLFGTWRSDDDLINVTWSTGDSEAWRYTHHAGITKLDLNGATVKPTVGWGWGSRQGFGSYAPMSEVRAAGRLA